jgi:tetratricopeptide (TPR) repeat protein
MNRGLIKFAASSLVLGAAMTAYGFDGTALAASSSKAVSGKSAAGMANQAVKLLGKGKLEKAVRFAEAAVAAAPANAEYRALLGQVYLASGRFESARAVLSDAVALDPINGRAALNLALAQTALAQNDAAQSTLEAAKPQLAAADYGLALALAGNVDGAIEILEAAARAPDATAKSRQNLALTYALANRWGEARTVAAQDLAPDALDARMTDWVRFVRPQASWDQVSTLLGVTAAWDPGMPVALAMMRPAEPVQAAAAVEPETSEPVAVAFADTGVVEQPTSGFEVVSTEAPEPALSTPVFEAPKPAIVPVSLPEPVLIKADAAPVKQAVVAAPKQALVALAKPVNFQRVVKTSESGKFVVQLGAFSSEARAQTAWKGASAKTRELGNFDVSMPRVQVKSASLYRLSVSGFVTREAAGQVCAKVKASGGQCFIRSITDAKPVQWAARGGKRIASR